MATNGPKSIPAVGFLTVVEHSDLGLTGGYLVLNTLGRPLEFHCTAPVKTNRAQEILYGPTLKEFLYGEQIGQTLFEKAQVEPLFVCTDVEPALALREVVDTPLALVAATSEGAGGDRLPARGRRCAPFQLGSYQLAVSSRHAPDQDRIRELWQPFAEQLDLGEPFERIREAIAEAQKAA